MSRLRARHDTGAHATAQAERIPYGNHPIPYSGRFRLTKLDVG